MTDTIRPALSRSLLAGLLTLSIWVAGSGCATSTTSQGAAAPGERGGGGGAAARDEGKEGGGEGWRLLDVDVVFL